MNEKYSAAAIMTKFLLGGIGTGTVSLSSRGSLDDWEIFNRPSKGLKLPYSFFSLHVQKKNARPANFVLEAEIPPPYNVPTGLPPTAAAGLPRLQDSVMSVRYPFATIDFLDERLPCSISMTAFNPFVPLNADDSGIPGFYIDYKVTNTSSTEILVSVAGTISNGTGFIGENLFGNFTVEEHGSNREEVEPTLCGVSFLASDEVEQSSLTFGNLAIATDNREGVYCKPQWIEGGWYDGLREFWDDFSDDGRLEHVSHQDDTRSFIGDQAVKAGSVGSIRSIAPSTTEDFRFYISWFFPNRPNGWGTCMFDFDQTNAERLRPYRKNYYSTKFDSAWSALQYLHDSRESLTSYSRLFSSTLYSSTIPEAFIEAAAANISVIRSTTCFRLDDGTFFGFEGSHNYHGSCEGSCTHVWNYAQTLSFLFPDLERTMRKVEFEHEIDQNGKMNYRAMHVFSLDAYDLPPASDGQLGSILRVYREWKFSGDDDFLRSLWPALKRALEYVIKSWDPEQEGVLDGQQHNTYDIEFYGINMMTTSIYFTTLAATAKMARFMKELDFACVLESILDKGIKEAEKRLWNGEYYEQHIEDVDKYRYQIGAGCLSDQLLGQAWAHLYGIGQIIPVERAHATLRSILKYNYISEMRQHHSTQRVYALNGESGLLLCSWPRGGRPKVPFIYSEEIWTGIEYEVATQLIYAGMWKEAEQMVSALRQRFDGYKRNPFAENECGNHYVRALASWGLVIACSGYRIDTSAGWVSFQPAMNEDDFECFWSCSTAWGKYKQKKDSETGETFRELVVLYGDTDLQLADYK